MSVITEAPEASLVSQPPAGVLFAARRTDLRLVRVARYPIFGAGGMKVGEARGQAFQFLDGKLFVPHTGTVKTEDEQQVDAAEIMGWLRTHRLMGDPHGGFWEVQTAAPPVSQEETQRILDAALALDVDTLQRVLEQERSGWDRDDVTGPVSSTIAKILAARERERERAEAEAAKAAKPKAAAKPAAS